MLSFQLFQHLPQHSCWPIIIKIWIVSVFSLVCDYTTSVYSILNMVTSEPLIMGTTYFNRLSHSCARSRYFPICSISLIFVFFEQNSVYYLTCFLFLVYNKIQYSCVNSVVNRDLKVTQHSTFYFRKQSVLV